MGRASVMIMKYGSHVILFNLFFFFEVYVLQGMSRVFFEGGALELKVILLLGTFY